MTFETNYRYVDRETKAMYVWLKYGPILTGRVLDVGADQCYLKKHLPAGTSYFGIGRGDSLDQQVDLEQIPLPFPDSSFDCVLCLDVLEHLGNIHDVFDELCRIARRYLIISLPNPYALFYRWIRCGHRPGTPHPMKFYGLPTGKPEDRHRWFFGSAEAENFIREGAARNHMTLLQLDRENDTQSNLSRRFRIFVRNLLAGGGPTWQDTHAGTMWAVLEKQRIPEKS